VWLLWIVTVSVQAQEIVTTSGGYGISAGSKVTWTIGEPVTETATGTSSILTQGFNQGTLIITIIKKSDSPGLNLKVYPNPASDHIKIVVEGTDYENLKFVLMDLNGKIIISNQFYSIEADIPVGNLVPSTYLLKIYQNETELSITKIIKK
jgi:hypothetical protein